MDFSAGVALIKDGVFTMEEPQDWADLGAGQGFFTKALASLLPPQSTVYAVDTNGQALRSLPSTYQDVRLFTQVSNFSDTFTLPTPLLDGILMANALHYVSDKTTLLNTLQEKLKPQGHIIIVAYDTEQGNTWVPYPISYHQLTTTYQEAGWDIKKIGTHTSRYQAEGMYAALLRRGV